jgi:hypothetical protein
MIKKFTSLLAVLAFATVSFLTVTNVARAYAAPCPNSSFFGLPSWYSHLDCQSSSSVDPYTQEVTTASTPLIGGINDIWKIVASVLEILLRLATLIAIGFVVYGGVTFVLSQGEADKTKQARQTIINALVGLVVSIAAASIVGFIAGKF